MPLKEFEMTHKWPVLFEKPERFNEETAPKWLCEGGPAGSTMCSRWFWEGHVLTLEIGQAVETDFRRIVRVA